MNNGADVDEDVDSEEVDVPDLALLQQGLSASSFEALMQFLPNRRFDCEDDEDTLEENTVFVAYTPKDFDVITETYRRLHHREQVQLEDQEGSSADVELKPILMEPLQPCLVGDRLRVLNDDGVIRINNILSDEICDRLLSSINEILSEKLTSCVEMTRETGFGNVLCRDKRWDVYLRNEGVYAEALKIILNTPGSAISELLGGLFENEDYGDVEFQEFSALISDPGSTSQPIHPDSIYYEKAPMFTVFLALQNIEMDMGATVFLPRTNNLESHTAHKLKKNGIFLNSCDYRQGLLKKGDVAIMDSKTLHFGDANIGACRRVLMYFTLRRPNYFHSCVPPIPLGSKWDDMTLKISDCV